MIPTLTHHTLYSYFKSNKPLAQMIYDPAFETLSFSEKLQSIGMFDSRFNLLFTPTEIPPIKDISRLKNLMAKEVFPGMSHSEYITGFVPILAEKGISIQSYLRGGYAAYVVCLPDYLEFLIHAFLIEKGLPLDLFSKELEALKQLDQAKEPPSDADFFDQVLTRATTKFDLHNHHLEFLGGRTKFKQKLIPTVSPLFPYEEEYVLFTIGNDEFQTDRIIGWLSHEYLFTRDDIRIKYGERVPESAGNFWQMVIDRSLKIVRTEGWHEKDFRAGLAALQLMEEGHTLLEEGCTLERIINYALSTGSDKIFTGARDRAKLHCKKPYGFLLSTLIAYLHADPLADVQILKDAIGEIPDLPSLYQFALLLTVYDDITGTYSAEWDRSGFLILHVDGNRIIFPKNFSATCDHPLPHMKLRPKANPSVPPDLHSGNYLTRVLIEIALQKPYTSSDALYDALIDYLSHTNNPDPIVPFLPKEFTYANKTKNGWIKALLKCSYKHAIQLYRRREDVNILEEIIDQMALERPNNCYVLLEDVPKPLRLSLLKKIVKSPHFSLQTSVKVIEEFIEENALDSNLESFIFRTLEKLIPKEAFELGKKLPPSHRLHQLLDNHMGVEGAKEWFLNSSPSQNRMDAVFQSTKDVDMLLQWIHMNPGEATSLFIKYRKELKSQPATYIHLVKQLHLSDLAKEWIDAFPLNERESEAVLFFADYQPSHRPLLGSVCQLPGLNEKKLLDILSKKGLPVFADRPLSELLPLLEGRKELLKSIAELTLSPKDLNLLDNYLKKTPSLPLISCLLEKKDFLPIAITHLLALKCEDPSIWKKIVLLAPLERLLIPFFRNYRLVESVYGDKAEAETKKWAKAIRKQKLEPEDIQAVRNILTHKKLQFTPLELLKKYLEKLFQHAPTPDFFHEIISGLLLSIQMDTPERLYHFDILLKLLKLGMKAKMHTFNSFSMLHQILPFVSPLVFEGGSFDPLYQHLQTLPLVDYGTEELYNQWISKRNEVFGIWKEVYLKNDFQVRDIKENVPLKTLPYPLMQAACRLSQQYKLNIEHYIENKITKKEFQSEIRKLIHETNRTFGSEELMDHEDPCIISIHDLSPLLNTNKRERTYEAFFYILKQRKTNKTYMNYLESRKKISDLIIQESTRVTKNEILYQSFICFIDEYVVKFAKSCSPIGILKLDPIIDAYDLEGIDRLTRIQLLNLWQDKLDSIDSPYASYYIKRVRSRIDFEKNKLDKEQVFTFLKNRCEVLRTSRRIALDDLQTEGIMIFQDANIYLNSDQVLEIKKLLDRALGRNTPISFILPNAIERPVSKKLPLISYLESLKVGKVTDLNLSDQFHKALVEYITIAEQGERGARFAFGAVLHLIQLGIEFGVLTAPYFTLLGRMAAIAPQYLYHADNKVVYDPYIDLLQSLSAFDLGSEGSTYELNKQIEEFFQYWNKHLMLTSLGYEYTVLETLPYDIVSKTRHYAREFGLEIERFIFSESSGEELKNRIASHSVSAFVNIQNHAFTRHTDPCAITLRMYFFNLKHKATRTQSYAALNQLCFQWAKNFAAEPNYIKVYREYLGFRRATEDVILNQIEYNKSSTLAYFNFSIEEHIQLLFNPSIPESIHYLDPIGDAIEIEGVSPMDKLFLLYDWELALNKSNVQAAKYHAKTIRSYLFCEAKKVEEKDAEKHLTRNVHGICRVRDYLEPKMTLGIKEKMNYIGSLTLSQEKYCVVLNPINEPPVTAKKNLLKHIDMT